MCFTEHKDRILDSIIVAKSNEVSTLVSTSGLLCYPIADRKSDLFDSPFFTSVAVVAPFFLLPALKIIVACIPMEESLDFVVGQIQCRFGVTIRALLAACIDAVSRCEDRDPSITLKEAQSACLLRLGFEGENEKLSLSISRETPSTRLVISGSVDDDDTGMTYEAVTALLSSGGAQEAPGMDRKEWSIEKCIEVFNLLFQCESKAAELSPGGRKVTVKKSALLDALTCLQCLQRHGIRHLHCTAPIPFNPLNATEGVTVNVLRELLVGFMVMSDSLETAEQPDPVALALLRVLGAAGTPSTQSSPIVLKASGMGQSSSSKSTVSLLVGRVERSTKDNNLATGEELSKEQSSSLWLSDEVTHMECNLDDITGEMLAYTIDLLLKAGAYDAWVTPIVMKKGRPAHTLHCLCRPEKEDELLELLFRHTTTLGIRVYRNLPRAKLCRSFEVAQTSYKDSKREGKVNVKVSSFGTGEVISMKPEFDHCEEISRQCNVPIKLVAESAITDMRKQSQGKDA